MKKKQQSAVYTSKFKSDTAKFNKLTKIEAVVRLSMTTGSNDKKPEYTVEQKIDPGKPAGTLIERAKAGKRFSDVPSDYWILGERAATNRPNQFDDNIHLMRGEKLIDTVKGTTHPGETKPTNPDKYNSDPTNKGAPVWDFGWHYGVWKKGYHKKMIQRKK